MACKVIGIKCALQCIKGRSARPEDTRMLDLLAWTANPSSIAKVSWITFTSRSPDISSQAFEVTNNMPAVWKRGITFRVLVHLDCNEDYTTAPMSDTDSGATTVPFKPTIWGMP